MEKVRSWCGQPSDRGRLKNRTDLIAEDNSHQIFAIYHLNPIDYCHFVIDFNDVFRLLHV